jgi:hypothetical protein
MLRVPVFAIAVALAGCATQAPVHDWKLSERQALDIAKGALAANNFEPSRYRWHQQVWRYTDTRDWYIEFSPRYPGPGGNDVLVVLSDESRNTKTVRVLPLRWSAGTRTVVPQLGGLNGPIWR